MVTVVAGPGFGKTMLLAAATADASRRGRDVWLSCEPADESADSLVAGLTRAFGLSTGAGLDDVLDSVWAEAPSDLCIVLDDVHEVPAGSGGAALLRRLTTELAANGHLVFASREAIPVPLARLAASARMARLGEDDMVFDDGELASFAAARDVEPGLLASTGGWPALVELTASAGTDLVFEYLWEEVLAGLGHERARLLALLAVAGGGDDEVASALAGSPVSVCGLVAGVPLVERSTDGWVVLHPLWESALRDVLTEEDASAARRHAATAHRGAGRLHRAVDLFVEAEAWDGILRVVRDAERSSVVSAPGPSTPSSMAAPVTPADFGRWRRVLPPDWRREPDALLAGALELQAHAPEDALSMFEASRHAFVERDDIDGELIAISHEGIVRWWHNDVDGLMALASRVGTLALTGSERARVLQAIGIAAVGHLEGDSDAVLGALADIDADADLHWLPMVRWLRSVAHRRNGDLVHARDELEGIVDPIELADPQVEIAILRIEWLQGRVDHVITRLPVLYRRYAESGNRYLAKESALELAARTAWVGDITTARDLLAAAAPMLPDMPSVLPRVLETIARAASAVAEGDDGEATTILAGEALEGPAAVGQPASWYWRDRAALALISVLLPSTRTTWADERLGAAHAPGLALGEALAAARQGDLAPVRALHWPEVGVVRAHLPLRWTLELAAVGIAAGNPPPDGLIEAAGAPAGPALRGIAASSGTRGVALAARRLAANVPTVPDYRLRIGVLGPLELWRDGTRVNAPELARQRVRELLSHLVARRRVRREEIQDELWPDVADPAHNLRVTLNHLQRALQPDRSRDDRPYFLRGAADWLELGGVDRLDVDVWELSVHLDAADHAERSSSITTALDAYRAALPLWRGEAYSDVPYALWAEPERTRLRARYVDAAIRAGELWLAAGTLDDAHRAASHAIAADSTAERAYRLLARAYVERDDAGSAREVLETCRNVLTDLGVEPDDTTIALVASLSRARPTGTSS